MNEEPDLKFDPMLHWLRSVRERLEVNRLFGWEVPLGRGALASAVQGQVSPGAPLPAARLRPTPAAPAGAPPPAARPRPTPAAPAGAHLGGAERARREGLLAPLKQEVAGCRRCGLCATRTQTVFGAGDPTARLMFVGEAPGFDEDRQGQPFVGRAGRLLNDIIKAMGLKREQVYIANVIKCRPPQNRLPNPAEVGACSGYLRLQIEIVAPQVLVTLGSVATKALLGTEGSISASRGRFHDYRGIPVMPTYHPSYLLRNPEEKRRVWEDMKLVMARLGLRK